MDEYYFKEGCYIEEWHNTADDPSLSVARVRVEHGKKTVSHRLQDTQERYVVLHGQATVWVAGKAREVGEKDVVTIPAGVSQSIRNDGESDLIFLAICTPRFREENYIALEE